MIITDFSAYYYPEMQKIPQNFVKGKLHKQFPPLCATMSPDKEGIFDGKDQTAARRDGIFSPDRAFALPAQGGFCRPDVGGAGLCPVWGAAPV